MELFFAKVTALLNKRVLQNFSNEMNGKIKSGVFKTYCLSKLRGRLTLVLQERAVLNIFVNSQEHIWRFLVFSWKPTRSFFCKFLLIQSQNTIEITASLNISTRHRTTSGKKSSYVWRRLLHNEHTYPAWS